MDKIELNLIKQLGLLMLLFGPFIALFLITVKLTIEGKHPNPK